MALPSSSSSSSSIDEDLSSLAITSLCISHTKDVTKCNETAFALPKKCHAGLYTSGLAAAGTQGGDSLSLCDRPSNNAVPPPRTGGRVAVKDGVPGFPNFPFFWNGAEGGSRMRRRQQQQREVLESYCKKQSVIKAKQAVGKNRRVLRKMHRKMVNGCMVAATNNKNISSHDNGRKWIDNNRHKHHARFSRASVSSQNYQKDMMEINQSLASLKW